MLVSRYAFDSDRRRDMCGRRGGMQRGGEGEKPNPEEKEVMLIR
jgi:hypothetical protein